jgi:WD40 repeat protein
MTDLCCICIQVWDFSSGELLYSITLGSGAFSILPYLTDDGGMRILVGSGSIPYEVKVIDHVGRRLLSPFPMLHAETITHIFELSLPDGPVFATTGNDGTIKIWDRSDYSLIDTLVVARNLAIWGGVPYVHPDGRQMLVVGNERGSVFLCDVEGMTCVASNISGGTSVLSLDTYTTAEGGHDRLVAGTRHGAVRLYTLPGLDFIRVLEQGRDAIRGLHVFDATPGGRCLVAAASENRKVTIVDTGDYRAPRAGGPGQLRSAVKTGDL